MSNRFAFVAGDMGAWRIMSMRTVFGTRLSPASHLNFLAAERLTPETRSAWILLGLVSNVRYLTRPELTALRAKQEPLGRPAARRAALIPIKKTAEWWELALAPLIARPFQSSSNPSLFNSSLPLPFFPFLPRSLGAIWIWTPRRNWKKCTFRKQPHETRGCLSLLAFTTGVATALPGEQ